LEKGKKKETTYSKKRKEGLVAYYYKVTVSRPSLNKKEKGRTRRSRGGKSLPPSKGRVLRSDLKKKKNTSDGRLREKGGDDATEKRGKKPRGKKRETLWRKKLDWKARRAGGESTVGEGAKGEGGGSHCQTRGLRDRIEGTPDTQWQEDRKRAYQGKRRRVLQRKGPSSLSSERGNSRHK